MKLELTDEQARIMGVCVFCDGALDSRQVKRALESGARGAVRSLLCRMREEIPRLSTQTTKDVGSDNRRQDTGSYPAGRARGALRASRR